MASSDRKLGSDFSIGVFESKALFFVQYKQEYFSAKTNRSEVIICLELPKIQGDREPLFFALPTSGSDLSCAFRNFTGIPFKAANPFTLYYN